MQYFSNIINLSKLISIEPNLFCFCFYFLENLVSFWIFQTLVRMHQTIVEGTSCNPSASIETSTSFPFKAMVRIVPILKLNIGGRTSQIDLEIVAYFNDVRQPFLGIGRVGHKKVALLNHPFPSYFRGLNSINQATIIEDYRQIENDL